MTRKLLSILLCSLLAAPTLSMGGLAPTAAPGAAAATAATAVPHLPDAAFRAGVSASRIVFSTGPERGGPDTAAPQSTTELREICFADAERALQACSEAGRANCSGIYEQDRRVCVTRYPYPIVEDDEGMGFGALLGWLSLLGVLAYGGWYVLSEEEATE